MSNVYFFVDVRTFRMFSNFAAIFEKSTNDIYFKK